MNQHKTYGPRDEAEARDGDPSFLGVNRRLAADKLPPGLLADAGNVRMSDGEVVPRLGVTKPGWLNVTAAITDDGVRAVGTFYGSGGFKDPNGFEWVLTASDGYIFAHKENNQRQSLILPTGVLVLAECTFCQAFNRVFCFRGRYLAPLVLSDFDTGFEDLVPHWDAAATYDAAVTVTGQVAEEVSYGPFLTVQSPVTPTSITRAGAVATVTSTNHGLANGDIVFVAGASQAEYNGTVTISNVTAHTFDYAVSGTPATPATGTITFMLSGVVSVLDQVTVTLPTPHGYVSGADVTITGAAAADYNGRWNITVVDEYSFTFQFTGSATARPAGTIKCSNMSRYYKALGSQVTLTTLTHVTTTATATKTSHGFLDNQYVTIAGATGTDATIYNGTFKIAVPTPDTFTYTLASDPASDATGTITAQSSLVQSGQSPDTHPAAWQRIYNVIPNADNALFINNRMLIPTAYTPSSTGYNSTASTYTKKDFIVATSIQDEIHFEFVDEFRINQGSDDEIVDLVKYDNDTVLVFKSKSWGILSNVRYDLSAVELDMRGQHYGLCARGAAVLAGKDVYFMSTQRGVVSLRQTEQGLVQSVDTPFSNDIEPWIRRINWNLKHLIRLAAWDNKLFAAVPLDDCRVNAAITAGPNLIADYYANWLGIAMVRVTMIVGEIYKFTPGNETFALMTIDGQGVPLAAGYFRAPVDTLNVVKLGSVGERTTATLYHYTREPLLNTNNAILVHDFRNLGRVRGLLGADAQAWASRDTGEAISPREFILATVGGRERLLYTARDGFVNLYEQSTAGDEVWDGSRASATGWTEIETLAQTRGYTHAEVMPKKFPYVDVSLSVWNARFTLTAGTGQARNTQAIASAKEFSRTAYLKPFDAQPYVVTNVNDDFDAPNRGNYSLALTGTGFYCGTALTLSQHYDVFARWSTKTLSGGLVQFTITNNQGRCTLKAVGPAAQAGPRRKGLLC